MFWITARRRFSKLLQVARTSSSGISSQIFTKRFLKVSKTKFFASPRFPSMYSHVQKSSGFKSGDETSYSDELMKHGKFCLHHCSTTTALCVGTESCWKQKLSFPNSFLALGNRWSLMTCCKKYSLLIFMPLSMNNNGNWPFVDMAPQTITAAALRYRWTSRLSAGISRRLALYTRSFCLFRDASKVKSFRPKKKCCEQRASWAEREIWQPCRKYSSQSIRESFVS